MRGQFLLGQTNIYPIVLNLSLYYHIFEKKRCMLDD